MGSAATQGNLWGHAASDWTRLMEPNHTPLFEAMLKAANVRTDTRFLDAGCGGGGASVLAAQRGAQVSGLDAAEAFIAIAQGRVPSGDFHTGDIEALPFENNAFDAVVAASSVQYAADRVAALRELGRVCTSEGRVVVGLFGPPEKVEYRRILQAVRDTLPEPPPGDGPFGLSAPGKLEGLMEEAGFNILESNDVDCPFVFSDFDSLWQACTSAGPFRNALRAAGEEKLKASVQKAADPFRTDDGRIDIAPNIFHYVVAAL